MNQLTSFAPILLIFLLCMILLMILFDLFLIVVLTPSYQKLVFVLPILTSLCLFAGTVFYYPSHRYTFFHNHFIWDPLTAFLMLLITSVVTFVFVYAMKAHQNNVAHLSNYYILSLFSILGMLVLITSGSMLSLYLGLELMALPLYTMVTLNSKSQFASETAMKYILMGIISSTFLLYGICLLYSVSGSLSLNSFPLIANYHENKLLLSIAGVLITVALLFKLGIAPFHFWVPDVYQSAATSVTLLIATAPKITILGIMLRLVLENFNTFNSYWQQFFLGLSMLSITLSNIIALAQTNIKRLIAYASISHMGFILMCFAMSEPGYAVALHYVISYELATISMLGALIILNANGLAVESIQDLKGLSHTNPILALLMLIAISSMAGIPPFVGFFAKLGVLQLLIAHQWYWVPGFALILTVMGMYYYLQLIQLMYFDKQRDKAVLKIQDPISTGILGLNIMCLLLAGLLPNIVIDICENVIANTPSLIMEQKLVEIK